MVVHLVVLAVRIAKVQHTALTLDHWTYAANLASIDSLPMIGPLLIFSVWLV
jgi:hypothetical protein